MHFFFELLAIRVVTIHLFRLDRPGLFEGDIVLPSLKGVSVLSYSESIHSLFNSVRLSKKLVVISAGLMELFPMKCHLVCVCHLVYRCFCMNSICSFSYFSG